MVFKMADDNAENVAYKPHTKDILLTILYKVEH